MKTTKKLKVMQYKKILFSVLAVLWVLCSYAQTRSINNITYKKVNTKWYQLYNGRQYEVNESVVTVKFVTGLSENKKKTIAQNNNCIILRSNSLGYYDLEITTNKAAVDVVEDLLANVNIQFAEPNTIGVFAAHANDTYYWSQWYLHHPTAGINAYKAWNKENGDPNVVIGILDSGTDVLHEDLKGNIWVNPGEDLDGDGEVWDMDDINGIDDDGNGFVDDIVGWDFHHNTNDPSGTWYHGTHVAGVIGAETNDAKGVAGIAGGWDSTDMGCKMLIANIGNAHPISDVIDDAILYVRNKGAKVITTSFYIGFSQAVVDAINEVYNDGVFLNASSGYYEPGEDSTIRFPANVENCFAVGANTIEQLRWGFSSYGEELMVVAPGVDIKSTHENNTYGSASGTSFSSPQVAATAGLILSRYPDFTPKDIEEVICLTAAKISPDNIYTYTDDNEYGNWNNEVGYGLLNVDRALGIKEDISSDMILEQVNYIADEVHVSNNSTLTLGADSKFYLLKTGQLIVDAGATLVIEDNVSINGKAGNKIIVNGNIQIGENVSFNKYGNTGCLNGVVLNNSNMQTTISNVTFNETTLKNHGSALNITHSEFNNCEWIYSYHGYVTIDSCDFTNTGLHLANEQNEPNVVASVHNSIFNNTQAYVGIDIQNYDYYSIKHNNINAQSCGVRVVNCGHNNHTAQQLRNNTIHDCGQVGFLAYNTKGAFYKNYIYDNQVGLQLMNTSDMALSGNPGAFTNYETNFITNNDSYEIYMSKFSFPWYLKYNVIIDEDNAGNPSDPMLYFSNSSGFVFAEKDIRYNCWGNNFNPDEDFQAANGAGFKWSPIWCPGAPIGTIKAAEQMYANGKEQLENQQYAAAKNTFMQIIDAYSKTKYAVSAMKELVEIEQYASNDYQSLKEYYQSNNVIQADTTLQQLSVSMANDCDIKLKKWPRAIDYYEGIINNPPSLEDSVFAIIDLGYLYFLMENSDDRSAYTGQLLQFKPKSKETFIEHRDYLLSLLPGKDLDETIKGHMAALKEGELLQNIPNPITAGHTQIWYKLNNEATVQLNIYNYTGQLISSINEGAKPAGTHHIDFNATGLTNGVYFYSININGQTTDTKKMTIVK